MNLSYRTFPLPAGTKATRFTVEKMVELIRAGIKSPAVRQKAVQVIKSSGARAYDQRSEVNALFSYVKSTFRFVKDPALVELIHTPEKLLEIRSGDCDDFTVFLSSLLGAVGYETRVAIVGPAQGIWSHTFPEVFLDGNWVALDATKTDPAHILAAKKAGNYKTFALQGGVMLGQGSQIINFLPGVEDVLKKILSFGKDMTVNYGPAEQAALNGSQGQALYAAYIDYGLPPPGAAALTVADLVTGGDKFADQKAWRKLVLTSPLLIAQKQYPSDPTKWPDGVLTTTVGGRRVRKSTPPPIDVTTDTRVAPPPEPDFRVEVSKPGWLWPMLLAVGLIFVGPKMFGGRRRR
ncbi:MAG: transglutaminase-like domain-containing protein [candidate division Zixibacteria bacterium]|nr:transglutaminase-like domain-containing protein [candidate division Zixibacteria bacterium]